MSVNSSPGSYTRLRRKRPKIVTISARKERNLSIKKVSAILQKDESLRTKEENEVLFNYSEVVKEAALRIEKRKQMKERSKEVEDSEAVLDAKCKQLAETILKAKYLVAYTGAGISTAAKIPDYRGASGIWTLLQQGKDIGTHDLTQADPTFTHMALFKLYSLGKLKHIVSQNCDGLHLRSGLPKRALSEVHGNMYIEVCRTCRPVIEYLRLFDVTENTGRYSHKTMRKCYKCNSSLVDSIVHFGERGNLPWPLNWKGACKAAEKADMILCIGSSLKVLKRYPWLWCMDKPASRRPHIYIVNLQWTPKDCHATIKINGKCDTVMEKLMKYLSIPVPKYSRKSDPIFEHATDLCKEERHTMNRPFLAASKAASPEAIEIKKEDPSNDSAIIENNSKSEAQESCVTSCKREVLIDTGQGEDVKCIKKELILITIRSGVDFKDCCSLFKMNQTHDFNCSNFVDEQNDIPVIIEDDVLFFKNNLETQIKVENVTTSEDSSQKMAAMSDIKTEESTTDQLNDSTFAHNTTVSSNSSNGGNSVKLPCSKRTHENESLDNHNKKSKLSDDDSVKIESKTSFGLSNITLPVLNTQSSTKGNLNGEKGNLAQGSPKRKVSNSLKCSFCLDQYMSNTCLFYVKRDPIFKKNVSVCDCCSSEEEDEGGNPDERISDAQTKTNPGWYGKGFRKNIRKKRQTLVN